MSKALKSRIERLEQRKSRRPAPRLIFHIYNRNAAEVIGYRAACGFEILRRKGEPLAELQARAWASGASSFLAAIYPPESALQSI